MLVILIAVFAPLLTRLFGVELKAGSSDDPAGRAAYVGFHRPGDLSGEAE